MASDARRRLSNARWIKSGGGPLSCVERELARHWLGVIGNSATNSADRPPVTDGRAASDYKRACSVSDYLGKIPLGDGHALILGDMPLQTFIWASRDQL